MSKQDLAASELAIEQAVSRYIGSMQVAWLEVGDEPSPQSDRGFIERNAIALLSNLDKKPLDVPMPTWLGQYSNRLRVRESGLWNQNHVEEKYDRAVLEKIERYARG
ncbi:MAG TPA: hypothetical protein VHC71_05725 [Hyphomicrobium sp.]|nr:hypothetical protein [Hyphomicrobium sp.]